jgi:SOS response regulatory protein OraA/RecX
MVSKETGGIMKKLIMVMAVLLPVSAWADCRKIEYAELKDMSVAELRAEYAENFSEQRVQLVIATASAEQYRNDTAQRYLKKSYACDVQLMRITSALAKKGATPEIAAE